MAKFLGTGRVLSTHQRVRAERGDLPVSRYAAAAYALGGKGDLRLSDRLGKLYGLFAAGDDVEPLRPS